mgnify:CR=1 FL=1
MTSLRSIARTPGSPGSNVTEREIVISRDGPAIPSRRQLVQFGLLIAAILAVVALLPLRSSEAPDYGLLAGAAGAAMLSGIRPELLGPLYRAWLHLGHVLGAVSSRIVLTALFFAIFLPAGLAMRLLRRDPLNRRFDPDRASYLSASETRDASHMDNPF